MTVTRTFTTPTSVKTTMCPTSSLIHLLGDAHFGGSRMSLRRRMVLASDMCVVRAFHSVSTTIALGDVTDSSLTAQFVTAVNFLNLYSGKWYAVLGNHDLLAHTPSDAAIHLGLPGANYSISLPKCRIIFVSPDSTVGTDPDMVDLTSSRISWIASEAHGSPVPVFVMCHWPLYGTSGLGEDGTVMRRSDEEGYYAMPRAEIQTMLEDTPEIQGWIAGHTHYPMEGNNLCLETTIAGRRFAAIVCSSPSHIGIAAPTTSPVRSLYAQIDDDGMTVFPRDHSAQQWIGRGGTRPGSWTMKF